MAFPNIASYSQSDSVFSTLSSFACVMPSGIQAGDLLIALIGADQNRTVSVNTAVSGSNWTIQSQGSPEAPNNTVTGAIITKTADGSGSDALTINLDVADVLNTYVIRVAKENFAGANSVYVSSPFGAFSANANPPNLIPTPGAKDYLWIVAVVHDAQVVATEAPTNFINLVTDSAPGSGGCSWSWATRELNASSLDPGTFTSNVEQYVAFTIAVEGKLNPLINLVNVDNTIYANSSNVTIFGQDLANGVYAKLVYANQEILMVDYVTSNTQPYFFSPSLADVFASRVQFTNSANLQILNAQSGIVATKIVSFQPPLTKTVHNVTDVSQASNVGSIYYGQSPNEITVGDQIVFDSKSSLTYNVSLDSQGFITIDSLNTDANDSFTYRVYESTAQVWGSEGTITFIGEPVSPAGPTYFSKKIKMKMRVT
jgi:hypothetical protein